LLDLRNCGRIREVRYNLPLRSSALQHNTVSAVVVGECILGIANVEPHNVPGRSLSCVHFDTVIGIFEANYRPYQRKNDMPNILSVMVRSLKHAHKVILQLGYIVNMNWHGLFSMLDCNPR
jgi:hypothetical protein